MSAHARVEVLDRLGEGPEADFRIDDEGFRWASFGTDKPDAVPGEIVPSAQHSRAAPDLVAGLEARPAQKQGAGRRLQFEEARGIEADSSSAFNLEPEAPQIRCRLQGEFVGQPASVATQAKGDAGPDAGHAHR